MRKILFTTYCAVLVTALFYVIFRGHVLAGQDDENFNTGLGHFTLRSLSPGHLFRPNITMLEMTDLPKGAWRFATGVAWGNVWNFRYDEYIVDAEWVSVETRLSFGMGENIELGIALPVSARIGGTMDGPIEDFHKTIGFDNHGRELAPRDDVLIYMKHDDGTGYYVKGRSWGINDIPFFLSYRLTHGDLLIPATAIQAGVSLPVGDEDTLEGIGEPQYSLAVMISKRVADTRSLIFSGLGVSYTEQDEIVGMEINHEEFTGLIGMEFRRTATSSLILQYRVMTAVAKDYFEFSQESHEVNAGVKWQLKNGAILELSVIENLVNFENSADFGLHFGLSTVL